MSTGDFILPPSGLARDVLARARQQGVTIATAESCTGGLIAAALTAVAGSSDVVDRGFVTYSNAAKQDMLDVRAATLTAFGAVSEQVAAEMAQGARDRSGAALAVSVTGIAGPGGSGHKPEGRVCFGLASAAGLHTETVEFGAIGRDRVRAATVAHALQLLRGTLDHSASRKA
ncbi:CinA family protein [Paracoccus jiaweipingae]|uniref:CinA family protein n=1 Tax=unclassified Paracoccus (in: a-proteobacteria) TaxID=2688777 RepID=UPI003797F7F0